MHYVQKKLAKLKVSHLIDEELPKIQLATNFIKKKKSIFNHPDQRWGKKSRDLSRNGLLPI